MEPEHEVFRRQMSTLRLVIGAMGVGVLGFAVVAALFGPLELQQVGPQPAKFLTIVCIAMMLAEAVAYVVARG